MNPFMGLGHSLAKSLPRVGLFTPPVNGGGASRTFHVSSSLKAGPAPPGGPVHPRRLCERPSTPQVFWLTQSVCVVPVRSAGVYTPSLADLVTEPGAYPLHTGVSTPLLADLVTWLVTDWNRAGSLTPPVLGGTT